MFVTNKIDIRHGRHVRILLQHFQLYFIYKLLRSKMISTIWVLEKIQFEITWFSHQWKWNNWKTQAFSKFLKIVTFVFVTWDGLWAAWLWRTWSRTGRKWRAV